MQLKKTSIHLIIRSKNKYFLRFIHYHLYLEEEWVSMKIFLTVCFVILFISQSLSFGSEIIITKPGMGKPILTGKIMKVEWEFSAQAASGFRVYLLTKDYKLIFKSPGSSVSSPFSFKVPHFYKTADMPKKLRVNGIYIIRVNTTDHLFAADKNVIIKYNWKPPRIVLKDLN